MVVAIPYLAYGALAAGVLKVSQRLLTPDPQNPLVDETPPVLSTRGSYTPIVMGTRRVTPLQCLNVNRSSLIEQTSSQGKGFTGASGVVQQRTYFEDALHILAVGEGNSLLEITKNNAVIFSDRINSTNTPSGTTVTFVHEGHTYSFIPYWGDVGVLNPNVTAAFGLPCEIKDVVAIYWSQFRIGGSPQWDVLKYIITIEPYSTLTLSPPLITNGLGPSFAGLPILSFDVPNEFVYVEGDVADLYDSTKVEIIDQPTTLLNNVYDSDGIAMYLAGASASKPTGTYAEILLGLVYDPNNPTVSPWNRVNSDITNSSNVSSNIGAIIGCVGLLSSNISDGVDIASITRVVPSFNLGGEDVVFNFHIGDPQELQYLRFFIDLVDNLGNPVTLSVGVDMSSGSPSFYPSSSISNYLGYVSYGFSSWGTDNSGRQFYRFWIRIKPIQTDLLGSPVIIKIEWGAMGYNDELLIFQSNTTNLNDPEVQPILSTDPGVQVFGLTQINVQGLPAVGVRGEGLIRPLKPGFGYDGANVAHCIYQILMGPKPLGAGLPENRFDLDSLEEIGVALGEAGEGLRCNIYITDGKKAEEILTQIFKEYGILMYFEEDLEKYKFVLVRDGAATIHFEDDDFTTPLPNWKKSYANNSSSLIVFSYPDRNIGFRKNPFGIFNDAADDVADIPKEIEVTLSTITDRETANKVSERIALMELGEPLVMTFTFKNRGRILRPGMKFTTSQTEGIFTVLKIKEVDTSTKIVVDATSCTYDLINEDLTVYAPLVLSGVDPLNIPPDPGTVLQVVEPVAGSLGLLLGRLRGPNGPIGVSIHASTDNASYGLLGGLTGYGEGGALIYDGGSFLRFKVTGQYENMFPDILSDFDYESGKISVLIGQEVIKAREVVPTGFDNVYEFRGLTRLNNIYEAGETIIALPGTKSFTLYSPLIKPGFSGWIKVVPDGLSLADVDPIVLVISDYALAPLKIPQKESLPSAAVYKNTLVVVGGVLYRSNGLSWLNQDVPDVPL